MNSDRPDPVQAEKAKLREHFVRYRRSLTDDDYEKLSAAIVERAADLPELRGAKTIHMYWPIIAEREVDTRPLIAQLESKDAEIVLPVVLNFDRTEEPALGHVRYPGSELLRTNKWGIAEPEHGRAVDVETLDAVIVPALGAGRNGHRVGHGRGYYDAFLSSVHGVKICLVYDACVVDAVPCESHDVAMDLVVTEREVVRRRTM